MPHYDDMDQLLAHLSPDVRARNGLDTPKRGKATKDTAQVASAPQEPSGASQEQEAQHHRLWTEALATYGADLPMARREYHFLRPWREHRFDYAWPASLVAVELDGGQWQAGGGRHNSDEDRFKLNCAAALGWRVLRFSGKALKDEGRQCVDLLRRALEARHA